MKGYSWGLSPERIAKELASEETSLELAVGQMPDVPCEHRKHDVDTARHGGEASHYVQVVHDCPNKVREVGEVYPACAKFVAFLSKDMPLQCNRCKKVFQRRSDFVRVLGPVGK